MNLELTKEHEDGSGTFMLDLNAQEIEQLVSYAVNSLLRNLVEEMKQNGTLPVES
jgi:hypothetical protein